MRYIKTYESEVSSGNASGKAGVGSLPFGRGYYQSGNNGAFGTNFTPSAEPNFKTYKSMKHSKKNVIKKLKKMKKFREFMKESFLGNFFSKKDAQKNIDYDNEKIMKLIYDKEDLKYTEGEFKPTTWNRSGDLLPNENRNDEIITDFAGMSIIFDTIEKTYKLNIPTKFNSIFVQDIKLIVEKNYSILEVKKNKYSTTIKFK